MDSVGLVVEGGVSQCLGQHHECGNKHDLQPAQAKLGQALAGSAASV